MDQPGRRTGAAGGRDRVTGRAATVEVRSAELVDVLGRCRFPDPAHGPVTLAVSGGADSAALAVLARAAGLDGVVVHVDHGLRPESAAEAAVVGRLAADLGFGFSSVRVEVPPGSDLEARARRARYSVLPPGVLTGHTMDDQAETVLLNLMRGAALDGLSGMRSAPVRRPLLGLRRADTVEVCRRTGFAPLVDPTNADPRFRRNRVRSELLPLLDRIAERDVVTVLARQAALLAEDGDLLEHMASVLDPTDVVALRAAPGPLARRALRAWLRGGDGQHPPSSSELGRVMDVLEGRRRACQISGGRSVSRRAGRLTLTPLITPPATDREADGTGTGRGTRLAAPGRGERE
jgi:tRNA(Ile)-lysidine synthase